MTLKGILEGTIRRDAESWVRDLMETEGYNIRHIEAENISYLGKNEQATCPIEIWYGEHDQTGVVVVYNMDAYGIARSSIWNADVKKVLWLESNRFLSREDLKIEHFVLTRREM